MTRLVSEFPNRVREIGNAWIPMPDGVRLAARIWLPEGAETAPVPAILEFIPYRKRDGMARRDEMMHPYFAGHGYAASGLTFADRAIRKASWRTNMRPGSRTTAWPSSSGSPRSPGATAPSG